MSRKVERSWIELKFSALKALEKAGKIYVEWPPVAQAVPPVDLKPKKKATELDLTPDPAA